jgi:predicted dehydrogenase
MKDKAVLVVGVRPIAQEYARILTQLGCSFTVVGRGIENVEIFRKLTGIDAHAGGLDAFLSKTDQRFDAAIVAVTIDSLAAVTKSLLEFNIREILVEKPGGNSLKEISEVARLAQIKKAKVMLAYNRRYYASVLHARKIIESDGGITSFSFEFTEWGHEIEHLPQSAEIKRNWLLANSSHVIDLAFYLGGAPEIMQCFSKGELTWHAPAIFAGAGISKSGALFSYQANWDAPGRWGVEVITRNYRLIFRPLEKLQVQNRGSVEVKFAEFDDALDVQYKPGFYRQTEAFLSGDHRNLCGIDEQYDKLDTVYGKILRGNG